MADYMRRYDTESNYGVTGVTLDSSTPSVLSNMISLSAGVYRGAQVSEEMDNQSGSVTDDLLVDVFGSYDASTLDAFAVMSLRSRPPSTDAQQATFDVPDSVVGHGFKVKLTRGGTTDDYEVTLFVQPYKISDA